MLERRESVCWSVLLITNLTIQAGRDADPERLDADIAAAAGDEPYTQTLAPA